MAITGKAASVRSPNLYIKVMVRRIDPVAQEAEIEITYEPLEVSLRRPPGIPDEVWGVLIGGVAVGAGGYVLDTASCLSRVFRPTAFA